MRDSAKMRAFGCDSMRLSKSKDRAPTVLRPRNENSHCDDCDRPSKLVGIIYNQASRVRTIQVCVWR